MYVYVLSYKHILLLILLSKITATTVLPTTNIYFTIIHYIFVTNQPTSKMIYANYTLLNAQKLSKSIPNIQAYSSLCVRTNTYIYVYTNGIIYYSKYHHTINQVSMTIYNKAKCLLLNVVMIKAQRQREREFSFSFKVNTAIYIYIQNYPESIGCTSKYW